MTSEIAALRKIADDAEESGDIQTAFQAWREIASKTGKAVAYCYVGRTATELGKWPEAETAFLRALEISPGFSVAMIMFGELFLRRADGDRAGNLKTAKVWLFRSLEIQRLAPTLSLLASAHNRLGEKAAAKRAWREALEVDNFYEEAYFNLAGLAIEERNERQAEKLLRTAIELDPAYFIAHGRLGELFHKQGRYLEAEAEFRRCIEIDPSAYFSHTHLADALSAQERVTEAEQEYRTALGIRPDYEPAITKLRELPGKPFSQ
ncbi:MAG: tetratricopeptide repeat protein [Bryobacteraceae bacterium]